jgi:hypothetical protein
LLFGFKYTTYNTLSRSVTMLNGNAARRYNEESLKYFGIVDDPPLPAVKAVWEKRGTILASSKVLSELREAHRA